ncbi:MAG: aminotransferase class I/II-fold pyridoxal phosphate-dependent enzyme, partial [Patescibacteria group bacterium]|nr:aminotransferase class I/II-fold pyridoxal phosphate-dependent enzyme [Patescibacteria group bacterium]
MINIAKPFIGKEEIDAVTEVLRSGMLAQGPKTEELETKFAKFCGTKYAVAVSNGTSGIHCALHALEIGPGDEVITTPFTFVGTANPVLMQGAKVVFCDISEDDYCIDPEKLEEKITQKTKAIIPVDLYGQIYQYEKVKEIADKHK